MAPASPASMNTKLRRAVDKAGGKLEGGSVGRWYRYQCESPDGKTWDANGCHVLVVEWQAGAPKKWREDAIADGLDRISQGVSECNNDDCEYCHPEKDHEQTDDL